MKNTFKTKANLRLEAIRKIAGLAVLVTAIALGFAACGKEDSTGTGDEIPAGGGGGSTITGNTIASGVTVRYDSDYITNMAEARAQTDFSYVSYYPNNSTTRVFIPLSDFFNGSPSVKINDGKLTMILSTPKDEFLELVEWDGLTVTPSNAKILWNEYFNFCTQDSKYALVGATSYNSNEDLAIIAYADRDVTIRGTDTWDTYGTYTVNYNVSLKRGWNYVVGTETSGNSATYTGTTTLPSGFFWTVVEAELY